MSNTPRELREWTGDDQAPVDGEQEGHHPVTSTPGGTRWRKLGVLLGAVVLVPVVVAVVWFARGTVKAGQGATAPEAASIAWMYDVRDGSDGGPGPYVDAAAAGDVARVRARVIAVLRAHPGSTLEVGSPPNGQATQDAPGTVTEWWRMRYPSDGGSALGPAGAARAWRFTLTQDGDEWWITGVQPPDMCEYFRQDC